MTRVINFGSLNVDHVYRVARIARPGETVSSVSYERFAGGKGLNQSIALSRAGARVSHVGKVGVDGEWLRSLLENDGVDVSTVSVIEGPSGHAVIQVDSSGENSIVIHGGANRELSGDDVAAALVGFGSGDFMLCQNETSSVGRAIELSAAAGLKVFINPAPMTEAVKSYPLDQVSCFIINRTEGEELTGLREPDRILDSMREKFPRASTALTLGKDGVAYADDFQRLVVPAVKVEALDATAAGDVFIGYFIAGLAEGQEIESAMGMAARAAAISVTRPGAASSIPARGEL